MNKTIKHILGRYFPSKDKEAPKDAITKPSWLVIAIEDSHQNVEHSMPPWYIKVVNKPIHCGEDYIVTNGEMCIPYTTYEEAHNLCERLLRAHESAMPWLDEDDEDPWHVGVDPESGKMAVLDGDGDGWIVDRVDECKEANQFHADQLRLFMSDMFKKYRTK